MSPVETGVRPVLAGPPLGLAAERPARVRPRGAGNLIRRAPASLMTKVTGSAVPTGDRKSGPTGDRKPDAKGEWKRGPKGDRKPADSRWKGPKSQPERKGRPSREPVDPERDTSNDVAWPEEIFELELDPELYAELESFGGRTSTLSKHLLSVQVLAESDPEAAYQHALRLRTRIPRSALTRQTACIAAYRAGHYKEAVKEEAAYRRISGAFDLVPIAADSERGLGRPQRALDMVTQFESEKLDADTRTELFIVAGGARRDLKDDDAARVLLQKAVRAAKSPIAMARSRFALGDLLADQGDVEQARKWLQNAVDIDEEGSWTDAAGRLQSLA